MRMLLDGLSEVSGVSSEQLLSDVILARAAGFVCSMPRLLLEVDDGLWPAWLG